MIEARGDTGPKAVSDRRVSKIDSSTTAELDKAKAEVEKRSASPISPRT